MATQTKQKSITKFKDIETNKIRVTFKRSILETIMNILLMDHSGFRTYKSVKSINRLFNNIDESLYTRSQELLAYIWCIKATTKHWIDGLVNRDLIVEACRRDKDFDNIKEGILEKHYNNPEMVTLPEAEMIFSLVSEALQYGVFAGVREEYQHLLDSISLDHPGAFRDLADRMFEISHSMLDIKYNTNIVSNDLTFNSDDEDSVRNALSDTIDSLTSSNNMLKTGIKRLNTLLSPAYMNGRIYTYIGLPGAGKSVVLLKSALDIRKYNPDFKPKTPGLRPCVLYISMENPFTEVIERVWNQTFDDDMCNYNKEEVVEKVQKELGISKDDKSNNIAIIIKYFPYRSISTDDLFTIAADLREDGFELCALVLDYIKRIRPSIPAADSVKVELARIINELKAFAVMQNIPVITAHQINRAGAAKVDNAVRETKADVTKLVGRENVGDAWEIIETSDWAAIINREYKQGTNEIYQVFSAVKRRRLDKLAGELTNVVYMAHPYAKNNGLRLLDDINGDKILSLQSLATDIDEVVKPDKTNAVSRPKIVLTTFNDKREDDYDEYEDVE